MRYDLIVVGGGIVGLGHAWQALREGKTVALFETSDRAEGASIRNFGMIWPIGQPQGDARQLALRGRELWLEVADVANVPVEQCGSLHLAHHDDEFAVLDEFASSTASNGLDLEVVNAARVRELTPAANVNGLRGGLYSRTELRVHPPTAVRSITTYLAGNSNVDIYLRTQVTSVATGEVTTADGRHWTADRIVIASGAYYRTLFPSAHTEEKLRLCKLQMMMTQPQPDGFRIGPHLASGLTLRHYPSFAGCPSIDAVRSRIAETMPELDRYGIHVMASQTDSGQLIIGDSHEYDQDIEPVDKAEIDDLILRELRQVIDVPEWGIARRWHGLYAKHPSQLFFVKQVLPDVLLVNGLGGNGMTLSLAVTEAVHQRWESAIGWGVSSSAT